MRFPRTLLFLPLALLVFPSTGSAQQRDTTQTDSTRSDTTRVTQLKTIEVTTSIAPTAGPTIGSGIPARISTVTGAAIDAWEPRLLADALATQPGISLYDDLGSPFKLNLSTRGFNVGPVVGLPPGDRSSWTACGRTSRTPPRSISTCCRWSTSGGWSC